jgi:hypothetical protein
LSKSEIQNLLVVGTDTVSIANSAKKAGFKIYAVDYFGDIDLRRVCSGFKAIIKQKPRKSCGRIASKFKPETFSKMARSLSEKYKIDAILLSSGLDDDFSVLNELNDLAPILGNHPRVIEKVRKKPRFFKELKLLGIDYPDTAIVKDICEAKVAAAKMGYPVVVKPAKGFGGANIRTARNSKALERAFFEISFVNEEILIQKFIDGLHASISLLATAKDVKILTLNEQLLGLHFLFQQEPLGYCGNIVPSHASNPIFKRCKRIAEKIALHFGLQGSNGIDLVVSKEGRPYVVEVNPRFQGSLECVERVLGINLVKSHVNACLYTLLPNINKKTSTFCTRLILYSPKRVIAPDLANLREVRDVPLPQSIIEKGEPICSIITEGKNQNFSLLKAKKLARAIYSMLYSA